MTLDPALVCDRGVDGPATHVLVLGIGTYDYLLGGILSSPEMAAGMRQVPAAARSGREVADFFLGPFRNEERPLGTLAMVLSEPAPAFCENPGATRRGPLPNGDAATVVDAIHRWLVRGAAGSGNLLVLYFAGHGLTAGSPVLLCRDYGKSELDRFDGAVNLNSLLVGLRTRQAGDQLLVIDACRSEDRVTRLVEPEGTTLGRQVLTPLTSREEGWGQAVQSVHFASSERTAAWAEPDGVTLYCQALLKALSGWGAQPRYGYWVGTGGLSEALDVFVARLAAAGRVAQIPDWTRVGKFKICRPETPMTDVRVACEPEDVWSRPLRLKASGDSVRSEHAHDPAVSTLREWILPVPVGRYTISVEFDGAGDYEDHSVTGLDVGSPAFPVTLALKRRDS